jgi:hypothetical protein
MFPATVDYINNEYIDNVTKNPVMINGKLKAELDHKAKKVLLLQRKGNKLVFPDILAIEKKLMDRLSQFILPEVAPGKEEVQDHVAKEAFGKKKEKE